MTDQRAAIEAGMGVGMLSCFLVRGLKEIHMPVRPVEPAQLIAHVADTIATNAAILNPDG